MWVEFHWPLLRPTTIAWTFGSEFMYVGTDAGNVHVVKVEQFNLSGYTVYWNYCIPT